MAAVAQLVNCLQSLFLAHEDKFCVTPTYHVFDMYAAHQDGQSLRAFFSGPSVTYMRNQKQSTLATLSGSASLKGKVLTITATNASFDQPRQTEIMVRGGGIATVDGVALSATDVHAHNTWSQPQTVQPKKLSTTSKGSTVMLQMPPASVVKLSITLT
jgi:alpha-N-arabinofuranosidase